MRLPFIHVGLGVIPFHLAMLHDIFPFEGAQFRRKRRALFASAGVRFYNFS
jgi:hypothetical protein